MTLLQAKSLRTLTTELTGLRVSAGDTSLWSIASSVNERARSAINDALRTYPFYVRGVEMSTKIPNGHTLVAVPPIADRLVSVSARNSSLTSRVKVSDFRFLPTPYTNLATVQITPAPTQAMWLEIEYESRVRELPHNTALVADISDTATTIRVDSPANVAATWLPEGYLELSTDASPGHIEMVYYHSINPTVGFVAQFRGQAGTGTFSFAVSSSVTISPVMTAPQEALAVILSEAEANMYSYWTAHRAQYDQYTAVSGLQQLDIADILAMVRTIEARAERRYDRIKRVPAPATARVKRRRDR